MSTSPAAITAVASSHLLDVYPDLPFRPESGEGVYLCGEGRRIIDAITNHRDSFPRFLPGGDARGLAIGQNLGSYIGNAQRRGDSERSRALIPADHGRLHAKRGKPGHGGGGARARRIFKQE